MGSFQLPEIMTPVSSDEHSPSSWFSVVFSCCLFPILFTDSAVITKLMVNKKGKIEHSSKKLTEIEKMKSCAAFYWMF